MNRAPDYSYPQRVSSALLSAYLAAHRMRTRARVKRVEVAVVPLVGDRLSEFSADRTAHIEEHY
jgi:hypothetical protein